MNPKSKPCVQNANGDMISRHELEYMTGQSKDEDKKSVLKYYISIIKNPRIKMSVVKIANQKIEFLVPPTSVETLSTEIQRYAWKYDEASSKSRSRIHVQEKQ